MVDAVHTKARGVHAVAATLPRFTTRQELPDREVVRLLHEREPENLRVDSHPASFVRQPVLGDPVVDELAGLEVRGETAPSPGRDASVAKEAQLNTAKWRHVPTIRCSGARFACIGAGSNC